MKNYELNGTYGGSQTPATILVFPMSSGLKWYCVEGSKNINATYDDLEEGVDVEMLEDVDTISSNTPIESLEQLELAILS